MTSLDVVSLNGNRFQVKAKTYVLAAGGIENARLLLASNDANPKGQGNDNDLVGRFLMEHIEEHAGLIFANDAFDDLRAAAKRLFSQKLGNDIYSVHRPQA